MDKPDLNRSKSKQAQLRDGGGGLGQERAAAGARPRFLDEQLGSAVGAIDYVSGSGINFPVNLWN